MNVDEGFLGTRIQQKLDGRGCSYGYREMWHAGSRSVVECCLRRAKLCQCPVLTVTTVYSWHINGYAKLKPYGFPIHGPLATRSQSCWESLEVTHAEERMLWAGCKFKVAEWNFKKLCCNDKTHFQVVIAVFKIFRDDHFFSIKFHTTFWAMNEALFYGCFTEQGPRSYFESGGGWLVTQSGGLKTPFT